MVSYFQAHPKSMNYPLPFCLKDYAKNMMKDHEVSLTFHKREYKRI